MKIPSADRISTYFFIYLISIACLPPLFSGTCSADIIYFKNGRELEGKVTRRDAQTIEIDLGFGLITFPRSQVEKIARQTFKPAQRSYYSSENSSGNSTQTRQVKNRLPGDYERIYDDIPHIADMKGLHVSYEYFPVQGKNLEEVIEFLKVKGPLIEKVRAAGITSIVPKLSFKVSLQFDKACLENISVEGENTIYLPRWIPPPDTPVEEVGYWEAFLKEIWLHEYNHVRINNGGLEAIRQALAQLQHPIMTRETDELNALIKQVDAEAHQKLNDIWRDTCQKQFNYDRADNAYGALDRASWAKPIRAQSTAPTAVEPSTRSAAGQQH